MRRALRKFNASLTSLFSSRQAHVDVCGSGAGVGVSVWGVHCRRVAHVSTRHAKTVSLFDTGGGQYINYYGDGGTSNIVFETLIFVIVLIYRMIL